MSVPKIPRKAQLAVGAALLLGLGAAGGAGAVSFTRPPVQMAPTMPTAIAKLAASSGIVTVKGKVAEVYGNRIVLQDASGRAMIDAGRAGNGTIRPGTALTVQGRFDDGQLRASYLVDPAGQVTDVGPGPHRPGPHGPGGLGGPGRKGAHGPDDRGPSDRDIPPPPPGCEPAPSPAPR